MSKKKGRELTTYTESAGEITTDLLCRGEISGTISDATLGVGTLNFLMSATLPKELYSFSKVSLMKWRKDGFYLMNRLPHLLIRATL